MPTGSGKTAVLMMAAFVLRARRVLIVTPSVLVRNQIAERFASLETLRKIKALQGKFSGPKVKEVSGKLRDAAAWEALKDFGVVVGTPFSLSPGAKGVATPPDDLFDLLLIDEAHHSRAPTWKALLDAFPNAKQIHFTATPFRRDKKALRGRFVYTYPLSAAYKDGIFGKIRYVPVRPNGADSDVAIAQEAERVVLEDRKAGFDHLLMVRTDSRKRADSLKKVYEEQTGLNLRLIHSRLSPRTVHASIEKLRKGELDGVICVDMLGEGFDLPALKIAAIHAPHKSLGVTLQFIGRFARTTATKQVSEAKFVAIPSEIEIERERLYDEATVWQEIVTNLSEGRIEREIKVREAIQTFTRPPVVEPNFEHVSLHALAPKKHVKIYRLYCPPDSVDITKTLTLRSPFEIIEECHWTSPDLATSVFITQERKQPEWTSLEDFTRVEYDLFIIYHDRNSNLLLINSSRTKNIGLYEEIARQYSGGDHSILPLSRVNSVLATLSDFQPFNIGMRLRALHPNSESYRISAGPRPQSSISPTVGAMYNRGHVSGIAVDGERNRVHIGYSSAAKVWSAGKASIPHLIDWGCELAQRIRNYHNVTTGSSLDLLSIGEEVFAIPDGVIAVDWPDDVYTHPRSLVDTSTGEYWPLVDFDIEVVSSSNGTVRLRLSRDTLHLDIGYALSVKGFHFQSINHESDSFLVTVGHDKVSVLDYFRSHPPRLFLSDFSSLEGSQLFRAPAEFEPFSISQFEIIDWAGVDIEREFYDDNEPRDQLSIHGYLALYLPTLDNELVFYDHGSGEMADYLTIARTDAGIRIQFLHCKGSSGRKAGSRFGDASEVASQVVKSLIWLRGPSKLRDQIKRRDRSRAGSYFIKGDSATLDDLVDESRRVGLRYEMVLVQPGISSSKLKENVSTVLASADYFIRSQCDKLAVWGSK